MRHACGRRIQLRGKRLGVGRGSTCGCTRGQRAKSRTAYGRPRHARDNGGASGTCRADCHADGNTTREHHCNDTRIQHKREQKEAMPSNGVLSVMHDVVFLSGHGRGLTRNTSRIRRNLAEAEFRRTARQTSGSGPFGRH
jgi:hypothetical protein